MPCTHSRQPVLQGGRNTGQKAQKTQGKKSCPEEFVAELCPKWKKIFKEVPYFSVMTTSQRQTKCNFNF
jgi:hypothetical protein